MNFQRAAESMRMPILGYFVVIGTILLGALALVSSELDSRPLPVSQSIGVPAPFKASLEPTADGSIR
jgi:hypothetical protein